MYIYLYICVYICIYLYIQYIYIYMYNIIYNYIFMEPIDTMKQLHQTNGNVYLHNQLCNELPWQYYGMGILYLKRMDKHG